MKKTTFIMMMAAALLSGQAFAGNSYTNATKVSTGNYAGTSGTPVEITESASGTGVASDRVYGVYSTTGNVDGGEVVMHGGTVAMLVGSYSSATSATASNGLVVMEGGTVNANIYGGYGKGGASNNSVIITGGTVKGNLSGATSTGAGTNNHVYLVGEGTTANINGTDYENSAAITLQNVYVGSTTDLGKDSTLDIYGYGIKAASVSKFDKLNFHLANSSETVLTLSRSSVIIHFDMTNVDISFDTVENLSVSEIALVNVADYSYAITLTEKQLATEYLITDAQGTELKGTLEISDDKKTLKLKLAAATPEPATATLSLLALAGLAARRRRH